MTTTKVQKVKAMDQVSHVLKRPDMYVGSVRHEESIDFIYSDKKIIKDTIKYSPGLLRVLVEALSNAVDNVQRGKEFKNPCTYINVKWNESMISIENDGPIVSVTQHVREVDEPVDVDGIWEPQLVFGRLLAGSNFDDTDDRLVSGKNGVGVSLLNIFSKKFIVEIHDVNTQKTYKQEWRNNMSVVDEPIVKKSKVKTNMIRVSFLPDYARFGYINDVPDEHLLKLFTKYVHDAAMLTKIPVYFNDELIEYDSLYDYAELYFEEITNSQFYTYKTQKNELSRCLIVFTDNTLSGSNGVVSFVNGVYTMDGGVHVAEWNKSVFGYLAELAKTKYKNDTIDCNKLSKLFWVFIDSKIPRPEFTSQSKTKLSGPKVPIVLSEDDQKNIKKIMKWDGFNDAMEFINKEKELKTLKKVAAKNKKTNVEGLEKANWAGTKKSLECTLIITEGLSAKTTAVKGVASQRDKFGVLPIRGKFLNVYKSSADMIAKNKVVKDLIQALNLKFDVDYTDLKNRKTLNYGSVMFCCDADTDGYHIEGLLIGFFATLFPTILQNDEPFLLSQRTPIIRCRFKQNKKEIVKNYYSKNEFESDKHTIPKNAIVKHFKGLGTLSDKDIKEVWNKKVIGYEADEKMDHMVKLVFGKDTNERKKWLQKYDPEDHIGDTTTNISVFLDKQMIKFSIEDCARSIPCMIDGFKESQRKVLYTCFKNKIKEIKVAQLGAMVAQQTEYKHGEQNLNETIINLAQDFTGSNNVPLLTPEGQFGTHFEGGEDAADARYIFTSLKSIATLLFRPEDECVLEKQYDEGKEVEYKYFVPILPTILFNGCKGIGTGYSCTIPNFNPLDVAQLVNNWITSKVDNVDFEYDEPIPWYRGFKGEIKKDKCKSDRYVSYGVLEYIDDDELEISCLPIGYWGKKFHEEMKDMVENKKIKDVHMHGAGEDLVFTIYENTDDEKFECNINSLKLTSYLSTSNIVCFDNTGRLKKYSVKSLIEEFCELRLKYYNLRVEKRLQQLREFLVIHTNKMRFISEVKNEKIEVFGIEKEDVENKLEENNYQKINDSYNYLFELKFYNITKSQIEKLEHKIDELKQEIKYLEETPVTTIWKNEIKEFIDEYENECDN